MTDAPDLEALTGLAATFDRWLKDGPNSQPHYPAGGRAWGTGDLKHFSASLRALLDERESLLTRIGVLEQQVAGEQSAPDLRKMARNIRYHLGTGLVSRSIGRDPKLNAVTFAEVPDWQLRQWLDTVEREASAIETRRAETENTGSVEDESAAPEGGDAQPLPTKDQPHAG